MSQYLPIIYKFIYCISINVLFVLSVSNNQSFQISRSNGSLILNKNVDSDSYYYFQNGLLVSNSTNSNYGSKSKETQICTQDIDCELNDILTKCCYNRCSLNFGDSICKGNYKDKCNNTTDCEKNKGFECKTEVNAPVKRCLCKYEYDFDKESCSESYNYDSKTAMQIYKITMIFASCCLALILIIFLVCILRKSYCPTRRQMVPLDNNIPDIFTLFPHVGNYDGGPLGDGTQPPFEKPPTYDETIKLMREEIGIPPPAYRGNHSPNSSNPSTPEMCSRIVITRPTLMTVNEDSNNSSLSSTDSSDHLVVSVAGPSGYQGFVNQAFSHI